MRAGAAAALLLLLLALAQPRAAAPLAPLTSHLTVIAGTLTPGVNRSWTLEFEGEPLAKGWVFLLEARVSASVTAVLALNGSTANTWTISPPVWRDTFVLPWDGRYDLTLTNPGTSDVSYALYFDQSCNCAAKAFPRAIHDGFIIFDVDVPKSSTVVAQFNKPLAMTMRVTAALLAKPGGRWPGDFTVLGTVDTPVQRQADPSIPPVWLYELNVSAAAGARVYYFVQGTTYDSTKDSPTDDGSRLVAPFIDFAPPSSPVSPLVLLAVAVVVGTVGVMIWRWPAIADRLAARSLRASERTKGKGGKKGSHARGDRDRKKAKSSPRGGDRGGRGTRTSRERSRRS